MDLNLIKNRISCRDYLQSQGILVPKTGRIKSPLRPDAQNPTSFLVSSDHWYDFGSGNGGDVIDLCAQLEFDGDLGKAIAALTRRLGLQITHPSSSAWHDAIQKLCNRAAYYHSKLTDDDRKYLHERGFTDETIEDVKIGRVTDGYLRGRLFLPYFKNGYVCYYATRYRDGGQHPESKYMKAPLKESEYYEHIPWGLPTLSRTDHPGLLVISEGYFDALSWYQEGYCVLSAITGRFSHDQLSTVLAACNSFDRVLIIYDNDPVSHAGAGFTQSMAEWLFSHGIRFEVAFTPNGVKDVNEYYAPDDGIPEHHHDLSELERTAKSDYEYFAQNLSLEEFTKFIIKLKRNTMFQILHDVIDKTTYSAETRKSLHRIVEKNPKEHTIADEVTDKHKLCSVKGIGFYEWNGKIWEHADDEIVNGYVDKALGINFTSNQQIKNITDLIKKRVFVKNLQFDKSPIITFQNGTLEIETGIFRDPTPADYGSIIMDYDYDPDATCPQWENFIHDISNGIGQREDMLQKIAGYIMRPDCNEQKIFILVGSGGNGKSVYLNILQKLYNPVNASHVEPAGITQDFQRIKLINSLMNIGSDISSDFSRGEIREYLNKIAAGDMISACYKGKDFVDFYPRCKLIYACNEAPRVSFTAGLNRRFMYVDFDIKYVEYPDPDNPLQHKVDKDIDSKLLAELPGIFNWAYRGYHNLIRDDGFIETPEQAKYLRDLEESADPVITFLREMNYSGIIPNSTIYSDYKAWCLDNGHKPLASNRFFPRVAANLKNRLVWNKPYYDPSSKTTYRACKILRDNTPDPDDVAYIYPTPPDPAPTQLNI